MEKIVFIALNTILLVLVVGILWSYSKQYNLRYQNDATLNSYFNTIDKRDEKLTFENKRLYKNVTAKFNVISLKEFMSKNSLKKGSIIYVGRITCPYCKTFIRQISMFKLSTKKFYYLNIESIKMDVKKQMYKKYNFNSVPALFKVEENKLKKFDGNEIKELKKFIQ